MKAEIKADGKIYITSETAVEAFALMHILSKADDENILAKMGVCFPTNVPIVFDNSVLNPTEKNK